MFWLCSESHLGSGRLSRTWIEEGDESPDTETECPGLPDCHCQGQPNAHIPYPFNGMGGWVHGGYPYLAAAEDAEAALWGDE